MTRTGALTGDLGTFGGKETGGVRASVSATPPLYQPRTWCTRWTREAFW
jgi:hypothetical protein